MNSTIPHHERLIVALDVPGIEEAKDLVNRLGSSVSFYKVGLELCMSSQYFELIKWLKNHNKKVFADLKLFDIPATVGKAIKNLQSYNIDFLTIHAADSEIMREAVKNKGSIKILAVTILTSFDEKSLEEFGFDNKDSLGNLVLKRAKLAKNCAIDGVIASGLEAPILRKNLGADFLIVTPGIRLEPNQNQDQKRVIDVKGAFANGANYIVVGRPITGASNPQEAAQKIQVQISQIFNSKNNMGE